MGFWVQSGGEKVRGESREISQVVLQQPRHRRSGSDAGGSVGVGRYFGG